MVALDGGEEWGVGTGRFYAVMNLLALLSFVALG